MEYGNLFTQESFGGTPGGFGVRIHVATGQKVDLETPAIRTAAREAAEMVQAAVLEEVLAKDPNAQRERKEQRRDILACFPNEPIFVEEVPNGYCSRYCCKHLPWFHVWTKVGLIKIGWRKRVISIDWATSIVTKRASELFPDEDVTKGDRDIHAYGYEKATAYLAAIIGAVEVKQ